MDGGRGSLDSGYHSMIAKPEAGSQGGLSQANPFIISDLESSPERSLRKLHKNISPTLSGAMQAISKTVRSTTSYIYPARSEPELPSSEWSECETPKKLSRRSSIMSSARKRTHSFAPQAPDAEIESPELPSSEWSECETPKKLSRRSSIMSSARKRTHIFAPQTPDAKIETSEPPQTPVPVTQEKVPALDVEIPNPCLSSESLGRCQISRGSQLLASVKLPAGPKNLWPGPTRLTVDQASGGARKESIYPVPSKVNDLCVDQGESLQPSMGSRIVWERHRADRERRYMEIVDMDCETESDENGGSDLQLKRQSGRKNLRKGRVQKRTLTPFQFEALQWRTPFNAKRGLDGSWLGDPPRIEERPPWRP